MPDKQNRIPYFEKNQDHISDLRLSAISKLMIRASVHPKLVRYCLKLAFRFEGGHYFSASARIILKSRFGVSVGAYSYGECFTPGQFQRNTSVGRYVSIGPGVRTYVRNHPMDTLSTHPFFYNSKFGLIPDDTVSLSNLVIEHDAWLGCNVVVTPGCKRIGIGAVVGAGSVVTKDVDDFSIVGGIPAKHIRYRFPESLRRDIIQSRWWHLSPSQLKPFILQFTQAISIDNSASNSFLILLASSVNSITNH